MTEVGGHVGGTVRVFNSAATRTMRVVGTATMPAIGVGHANHLSLGSGAILPASSLPQALLNRDAAPCRGDLIRSWSVSGRPSITRRPPGG